jgi:hypothetical protein
MSDKSGGFSFALLGIGGILKKNQLRVPPHQREYAWTKDKVKQLIEDLTEAKETDKDHFLGTIVTIDADDSTELKIVDGQQRLTTTTLLVSAIRDYLQGDDSSQIIVTSIESEFLTIIDRRARERIPRLSLNIDDNDFFKQLISSSGDFSNLSPTRESHDLLLEAAEECAKWVKRVARTHSASDIADRLNDWLEYLENRATAVLLSVSDGSRAFKMFETLNDRGLRTSQADLVKSYLFGEAGNARLPEAQARWSTMRETLQELDDDDRTINFLWHSLIATRKYVRSDEVYDTISQTVRGGSNAAGYLTKLESLARVYVSTYSHDSDLWSQHSHKTKKALQVYNRFDPKPVRPLILAIAAKMPVAEVEASILHLVSLAVRSVVTGQTRSGTFQDTYANAALMVYTDKIADVASLKVALRNVTVSDEDFEAAFSRAKSSKAAFARYYLHALEAATAKDSEPWYVQNDDPNTITLEHIMPRSITDQSWSHVSEEDHRRNLKRLGNLCLLQKTTNSDKKNTFIESKSIYSSSPYSWTSVVGDSHDWDIAEIENRQKAMAKLAVTTWPV